MPGLHRQASTPAITRGGLGGACGGAQSRLGAGAAERQDGNAGPQETRHHDAATATPARRQGRPNALDAKAGRRAMTGLNKEYRRATYLKRYFSPKNSQGIELADYFASVKYLSPEIQHEFRCR